MKIFVQKMIAAGAGLFLTTNVAVYGNTVLYSDASVDTGSSLNFVNGTAVGNEIIMAGTASFDTVTSFAFEYYSPDSTFIGGNNVKMDVILYANDGTPFNGHATPSSILFNSGFFTLNTPQQNGYGNYATLTFDLSGSPITVPKDFTMAFEVTGLVGNDISGMELFDPATVGQNYGDYWYWVNSGSGWQLDEIPGVRTDFGAVFYGTAVPDAASTAMLLGAALSGLALLRRKLS